MTENRQIQFSQRVRKISPSPIRKFAPASEAAKAEGKVVIPLNIGQPDVLTPQEYLSAIAAIDEAVIAYTASNGIEQILNAFSKYYHSHDMPFYADDILITNGGSEALSFSFAVLCDPGDEVIVFEPYYTNYNTLAKVMSVQLTAVATDPEEGFALPSEEAIVAKINERTKAMLITNPDNPTGSVLTREEVARLVKIACEHDLFIIADEVYREFIYNGSEFVSFTQFPEALDRLVIIDSVSKRYSGCGIRIGCVASKNADFIAEVLKLCQSRLCVAYAEQLGAAALFDTDENYIAKAVEVYRHRRDVCMEELAKIEGAQFKCPNGAFYFILGLPVDDSDKFTAWLLSDFAVDNETVMLCPAKECYQTPGHGYNEVRISYCIDEERLRRAMNIIRLGVIEYNRVQAGKLE